MGKIRWSQDAYKDLEEIYSYVSRDSKSHAESLRMELLHRVDQLTQLPRLGPILDIFLPDKIRMVLSGKYRILYECQGEVAYILRIVHGSRLLKKFF